MLESVNVNNKPNLPPKMPPKTPPKTPPQVPPRTMPTNYIPKEAPKAQGDIFAKPVNSSSVNVKPITASPTKQPSINKEQETLVKKEVVNAQAGIKQNIPQQNFTQQNVAQQTVTKQTPVSDSLISNDESLPSYYEVKNKKKQRVIRVWVSLAVMAIIAIAVVLIMLIKPGVIIKIFS